MVELFYTPDENDNQSPVTELIAYVSVSSDLKTIAVDDDLKLFCQNAEGGWTVKGDILQNLLPERQDCWELGPPPLPSDQDLIDIASNTAAGKSYLARFPENKFTIARDDIDEGTMVIFTPKISEPIQYVTTVAGFDRVITNTYIVCSHGDYRSTNSPRFWSSFQQNDDCLQSVHDILVVANETEQVKAFQTKYPSVGLHRVDNGGRFTVTGTDSTIKYLWVDEAADSKEARLIVKFKPGTIVITDFEAQCDPEPAYGSTPLQYRMSGIDLDVTEFLQDSRCPDS